MRQSNKCGNDEVRNDERSTYTWDLVRVLESKSLSESGLLIKSISKTIKNE